MALLSIVLLVFLLVVEAPEPLEPFTGSHCPWQQVFHDCLKQMCFQTMGSASLPCPASLQSRSLKLQKTREHRGGPLCRCVAGRSIQTFTVDVSCFEVDTVCTQESTLKRTQLHLFPSFQGAGSALPFLPVGAQGCTQHLLPTDLPSWTSSHTAGDSQGTQESRELQVSVRVHQVGL